MSSTDTIVVGAGQAGLAVSYHLTAAGHDHVVLDRGRVGERWRSERWDSLVLLTPNWLNELPGAGAHADRDGYLSRDGFVSYLAAYAASFGAPLREGAKVTSIERAVGGFHVETGAEAWSASSVVLATGDTDAPNVPELARMAPSRLAQVHGSGYRSPAALPSGAVLVVGAGPSGQQIALELRRAGRPVVIAVGTHARMPRRYRGRDVWHWLDAIGNLDETPDDAPRAVSRRSPSLALTGANGGEELGLDVLARHGIVVAGRLTGFDGVHALFADDLETSVADSDRRLRRVLDRIDAHVARDPRAAGDPPPEHVPDVVLPSGSRALDLRSAGVSAVVWATGYRRAYPWLRVPVVGPDGELVHRQGVTSVPGLYALGLRFQRKRKSHFIGGVGEDAAFVADAIVERARPGLRAA